MRDQTVARNYAGTLFELALRHEGLEVFGAGMRVVSDLLEEDPDFRLFLETPRIAAGDKKAVLRNVFGGRLPTMLLSFLLVMVDKRRQRLLRDVAREYDVLVDEHEGRVHVDVTVARPLDEATRALLAGRFSDLLGRRAIPHVRVKPEILGGVIVRTGDTIYDGSVRRRLEGMRRRLLTTGLPAGGPS